MNLFQLAKGKNEIIHNSISVTTTSVEKKANGHNAIIIYFELISGSGTWTIDIYGKSATGTFIKMYDINGNAMSISSVTANKAQLFVGIPEYFKVVATENVNGATISVSGELLTV